MYTTASEGRRFESARVHRRVPAWVASMGAALSALMVATTAYAQTIEYTVTDIPRAPDAFNIVPLGINNGGEVVGWAQFQFSKSNPFFLRAWKWVAEEGLTLLPPPPGAFSNRYGARDISDTGIITGDAGGDGGVAWRFENGQYTFLGALPNTNAVSTGMGVNDTGDVAGTSGNVIGGQHAFMFTDGLGIVDLTPAFSSEGRDINNARQVAGWMNSPVEAIRISPGVGIEFLGFPPSTNKTRAYAINQAGDVVGEAFFSPNVSRAFLFTNEDGIQTLPGAQPQPNSRNQATGINIHREVVGNGSEGPIKGWVWTAQTATRNLSDLVDPSLGLNILMAFGINDRGQIIAIASDLDPLGTTRILLLTPPSVPGELDGDGDVDAADLAILLGSWGPCGDCGNCPADLDGDCTVGASDLAILLGNWG